MVRALAYDMEGPGIEITFDRVSGKTLFVHLAAKGYQVLFKAEEGRGDFLTCPVTHVEPLHSLPLWPTGYGTCLYFAIT